MEVEKAALLCPVSHSGEVFMIERSFFNEKLNIPERFPGEWTFAGGHYSPGDKDLIATAEREFREETGYEEGIHSQKLMFESKPVLYGKQYLIHFYSAALEFTEGPFRPHSGEVVDLRWFFPKDAIALITSDTFEAGLLNWYSRYDLGNEKYGPHKVTSRKFPHQTLNALEFLLNGK
ncbi:NUDIX hydrolase [archaeon]|jgi:8-oxo-dGTP pyrophosphatase MutT (NUDIX family)|nr:NUDIX hydrolase [archaeon]MBT3578039.1 NUDIX hydrolase [archaeon]MBT6819988.1 NUDIX hydrolase [archaeon]MBT7025025.1 NUDIX hydrolase [archaeon]MBT7238644.1 NUDIX hydrolase [archaeon]